jgi:branched-chain amino acid transport system permease protein
MPSVPRANDPPAPEAGPRPARSWLAPFACLVAVGLIAALPPLLSPFAVRIGQLMFYSAGLALAWNLMGGLTGYRSFGHAAFVGMGAFAAGLLETNLPDLDSALRLAAGLGAAITVCAIAAAILAYPLLRLRGAYFAIAMLGVSHVAGELNTNVDALSGAMGLMFPNAAPDALEPPVFYYELSLAAAFLVLALSWALRRTRLGYGLLAIREDEDTARMLGVPTERYKTMIFVLSAALTGLLGAIYAHSLGYVTSASLYRDDTNLNVVVFAMLGGMSTLVGPVIGAFFLVLLVYVALSDYPDVHLFVTGFVLVVLVLAAPDGVLGLAGRWRERWAARRVRKAVR